MNEPDLATLEAAIGYTFTDRSHLEAALIHRSYAAENAAVEDNERMEFLGDAVLQLAVTDFLYEEFPELREGQMAKVRAACVNGVDLAILARRFGLGDHLRMGLGEEASGGREKGSLLADAVEAVIAAVYLDGGAKVAHDLVLRHWADLIRAKAEDPGQRDYKTRYQEMLAAEGLRPEYAITDDGPDHAKTFEASVSVDGQVMGRGVGRSKKEAEQNAAREALERRT